MASKSHRRPPEDHAGVRGVQGPQLHHQEEPAQRPRPARAEEVLPALRQAHRAPRDPLDAGIRWIAPVRRPHADRRPGPTWSDARRFGSSPSPSARALPCVRTSTPPARPGTPTWSLRPPLRPPFTLPQMEAFLRDPARRAGPTPAWCTATVVPCTVRCTRATRWSPPCTWTTCSPAPENLCSEGGPRSRTPRARPSRRRVADGHRRPGVGDAVVTTAAPRPGRHAPAAHGSADAGRSRALRRGRRATSTPSTGASGSPSEWACRT